MTHLRSPKEITGFTPLDLIKLKEILEQYRYYLEEGNAFEYWEDVEVTTPATPGNEFSVTCSKLNKVPRYYLVIKKDKAVDVYTGDSSWSRNVLFLKASVASATITVKVIA